MNKNSVSDQIINKVSIVDEISKFVDLTKKGQNYLGICPFHDDNKPSFTVSSEKKIFKCFVCGVGGNIIKFHQMINNCDYATAVINLGSSYQIDVSSYVKNNANNPKYKENLNSLIQLNLNVNEIFQEMLLESKQAQKYLLSRNLKPETIKHFKIGYKNENINEIAKLLAKIKISYQIQQESSLVVFTKDKIIDFFRNRITIPIFDEFNNLVGFGSRIIDNSQDVKYLNTKENKLFSKRNILFNFYDAKLDILNNNKNTIIVVEGYMDVISLYNQNIKNVVAVMTNNITKEQVDKLTSLNKQILLCLDFDNAGISSTYDFIQKYPNVNIKIVKLEKNCDPDEFINKNSRQKLIDNISNPMSPDEFIYEVESLGFSLNKTQKQNYETSEPSQNYQDYGYEIPQTEVKQVVTNNIEIDLIKWIVNNEEQNLQKSRYDYLDQKVKISYEHSLLIRLEFSVFKWFINKQINFEKMTLYFDYLSTNIIKKWILMEQANNQSLDNIKNTIMYSLKENYLESVDVQIFELIQLWHSYEMQIEKLVIQRSRINNDIIIKKQINSLIQKQREEFIIKYKNLRS